MSSSRWASSASAGRWYRPSTAGPGSAWSVAWSRWCSGARAPAGAFVTVTVPPGPPGYSQANPYRKIGWHALDTREQVFDHVRLPLDHVVGGAGTGLRAFLSSLDAGRISFAALSLSLAQAALDEAIAYAQQRIQFGQPISRHQAI